MRRPSPIPTSIPRGSPTSWWQGDSPFGTGNTRVTWQAAPSGDGDTGHERPRGRDAPDRHPGRRRTPGPCGRGGGGLRDGRGLRGASPDGGRRGRPGPGAGADRGRGHRFGRGGLLPSHAAALPPPGPPPGAGNGAAHLGVRRAVRVGAGPCPGGGGPGEPGGARPPGGDGAGGARDRPAGEGLVQCAEGGRTSRPLAHGRRGRRTHRRPRVRRGVSPRGRGGPGPGATWGPGASPPWSRTNWCPSGGRGSPGRSPACPTSPAASPRTGR